MRRVESWAGVLVEADYENGRVRLNVSSDIADGVAQLLFSGAEDHGEQKQWYNIAAALWLGCEAADSGLTNDEAIEKMLDGVDRNLAPPPFAVPKTNS